MTNVGCVCFASHNDQSVLSLVGWRNVSDSSAAPARKYYRTRQSSSVTMIPSRSAPSAIAAMASQETLPPSFLAAGWAGWAPGATGAVVVAGGAVVVAGGVVSGG